MQENIHYRNEAEPTEVSTNNRYYVDMEARFEAFRNHEIDMRSLHTMVYDVNNVALAVRQLSKSSGKDALGPDGTSYSTLEPYSIAELSEIVKDRLLNKKMNYVRRTYIPKSNGKARPLGICSIWDKLVEKCIQLVLEPHCETQFGAVDKIPFPPNYATIRGKGGGGMQLKFHTVTIEDLMPQDHFLRRLEAALDLSFVRVETAHLYSRRYGRPPIDPVVLVKYLLVGFLYGIPSERQIEQRIQTDVALRWYLGLDLFDRVPDHSTISQLRRRKPSFRKIFRRLFEEVVGQCVAKGLASGRLVGTDSTHVKANASWASEELVELPESPGVYWERLDTYEEEGLEELERRTGKRRKKRVKQIKKDRRQTRKWVSRTDPESGHMKRPGKPRGQHYLAHQTVDTDCGVILDVTVTPGDVYDSVPYLEQIERIHRSILPIQAATADAAYDFPLAHQALKELEIQFFVRPQAVHDRTNVELKREAFQYDESLDAYVCPNGKLLRLNTLHRSASGLYWLYLADKQDCQRCPLRKKCLSQQDKRGARKLEHSYFTAQRKRNLSRLSDPIYREALKKRQIWCEGTFAAQKRGHNLTQILRRGLEAAEDHCLLSATALNLKRMIWAMK